MSHKGFSRGDFDTRFEADPKFRALRAALPSTLDYLAAVGAFYVLQAASWADAARVSIRRLVPDLPAHVEAALVENRLIGKDGRLPRGSFDGWVGRAIARRDKTADRTRRWRATPATDIDQPATSVFAGDASHTRTRDVRGSGDSPRRSSTKPERAPELDGFVALANVVEELTGRPYALANPFGGIGAMAAKLVEDFGIERTVAAVRRAGKVMDHPDARALIFSANDVLRPVVSGKALAAEERREEVTASSRAAVERTRARLREAQEWLADDEPTVHDPSRKAPALPPTLPPRVARTGDTP